MIVFFYFWDLVARTLIPPFLLRVELDGVIRYLGEIHIIHIIDVDAQCPAPSEHLLRGQRSVARIIVGR